LFALVVFVIVVLMAGTKDATVGGGAAFWFFFFSSVKRAAGWFSSLDEAWPKTRSEKKKSKVQNAKSTLGAFLPRKQQIQMKLFFGGTPINQFS